ncbi:MAG: DUF3147 family protein [Terriglobales bacterium]
MIAKVDLSSAGSTTWGEYASRFLFGGAVTLLAGLIADKFGPATGGLFLAFPAIFPAGASLIEKHQQEKKRRAGMNGKERGRLAAGVDAAGAAIGCLGLMGFAAVAWKLLPQVALWLALLLATGLWMVVAVTVWFIHKRWC